MPVLQFNAISKNLFHRDGTLWTAEDYEELLDLYQAGYRWGLIASELGRTVPACVNALRSIRKFARLPKKIWRPRPVYQLKNLDHKGRM